MPRWLIAVAVWLYECGLRVYPRHFREAFAAEMLAVFRQALVDAADPWRSMTLCLNELFDWPAGVVREHWRDRGRATGAPLWRSIVAWVGAFGALTVSFVGVVFLFGGSMLLLALLVGLALTVGIVAGGLGVGRLAPLGPGAPVPARRPWLLYYQVVSLVILIAVLVGIQQWLSRSFADPVGFVAEAALFVAVAGLLIAYFAQLVAAGFNRATALLGLVGVLLTAALCLLAVPPLDRGLVVTLIILGVVLTGLWKACERAGAWRGWLPPMALVVGCAAAAWLAVPEAALTPQPAGVRLVLTVAIDLVVPVGVITLIAGLVGRALSAQPPTHWATRALSLGTAGLFLAGLVTLQFYQLVWDMATDGVTAVSNLATVIAPTTLAVALLLGWTLPGWRKVAAPVLAGTILALTSSLFTTRSPWEAPHRWTVARAEGLEQAIVRYYRAQGQYPAALADVGFPYTTRLYEPMIFPRETWCYEGGPGYFRLGYVDRPHFGAAASDYAVVVEAWAGEAPQPAWACDDRLKDRQSEAPR